MPPLSVQIRHRKFAETLADGTTQTQAAIVAGYSTKRARATGSVLASKRDIQNLVLKIEGERRDKARGLSADIDRAKSLLGKWLRSLDKVETTDPEQVLRLGVGLMELEKRALDLVDRTGARDQAPLVELSEYDESHARAMRVALRAAGVLGEPGRLHRACAIARKLRPSVR